MPVDAEIASFLAMTRGFLYACLFFYLVTVLSPNPLTTITYTAPQLKPLSFTIPKNKALFPLSLYNRASRCFWHLMTCAGAAVIIIIPLSIATANGTHLTYHHPSI